MVLPELVETAMQERLREAAQLRRQHEALKLQGQAAPPRGGLSPRPARGLPLLSFVARGFRTASVP